MGAFTLYFDTQQYNSDDTLYTQLFSVRLEYLLLVAYRCDDGWVCLVSNEAERDKIGSETTTSSILLRRTMGSKPKFVLMKLPMSRPNPKAMQPITHMMAFRRD